MRDVHEHLSKEDHECLHNCEDCHDACLHQIQHCLEKGGNHARPEHIRLLQDCSQMCHTSADFILRGSPLHGVVCEACAQVCDACAKACAELGDTKCADICRRCAQSCHGMMSHRHRGNRAGGARRRQPLARANPDKLSVPRAESDRMPSMPVMGNQEKLASS